MEVKKYGIKSKSPSEVLEKEVSKVVNFKSISFGDFKTLCKEALGENYNEEKVDSELNALFSEASEWLRTREA